MTARKRNKEKKKGTTCLRAVVNKLNLMTSTVASSILIACPMHSQKFKYRYTTGFSVHLVP